MIKGIFKTSNTFLLLVSNFFNHYFTEHGNIVYLVILFHHWDTILKALFIFLNLTL